MSLAKSESMDAVSISAVSQTREKVVYVMVDWTVFFNEHALTCGVCATLPLNTPPAFGWKFPCMFRHKMGSLKRDVILDFWSRKRLVPNRNWYKVRVPVTNSFFRSRLFMTDVGRQALGEVQASPVWPRSVARYYNTLKLKLFGPDAIVAPWYVLGYCAGVRLQLGSGEWYYYKGDVNKVKMVCAWLKGGYKSEVVSNSNAQYYQLVSEARSNQVVALRVQSLRKRYLTAAAVRRRVAIDKIRKPGYGWMVPIMTYPGADDDPSLCLPGEQSLPVPYEWRNFRMEARLARFRMNCLSNKEKKRLKTSKHPDDWVDPKQLYGWIDRRRRWQADLCGHIENGPVFIKAIRKKG